MMKPRTLVVCAILMIAGALVNGAVTRRWDFAGTNPEVTNRLHTLAVRFDDWQAKEADTDMPKSERAIATARRYMSPRTGHSAAVTLFSGVPGAVATHTPDVCYPGSGYRLVRGPLKETTTLAGGETVEFYIADFEKKKEAHVDRARVRWAWATKNRWIAPDNPRWQFARDLTAAPEVYKLYIVTTTPEGDGDTKPEDDGITNAFVRSAWEQYTAALIR